MLKRMSQVAAATALLSITTVVTPAARAVDGVTVTHLPAKVRLSADNPPCISFTPDYSGPNYWDSNNTHVTANGVRYASQICTFGGKMRKKMLKRKGMTFTVNYGFEYRQPTTGTQVSWKSFDVYSNGDRYERRSGVLYYNPAGVLCDYSGSPRSSNEAADETASGRVVEYGPSLPWTYQAELETTGSYRTTIRLVRS